jgi:hypothetical protein
MDESELLKRLDAAAGHYLDARRIVKQRQCEPGSPECDLVEELGEAANKAYDALETKRSQTMLPVVPEDVDKPPPARP